MSEVLFDRNNVTVIAADGYVTTDNACPPEDDLAPAAYTRKDTPNNRTMMLGMAEKWTRK